MSHGASWPIGDQVVALLDSLSDFFFWLWKGQAGPAIEFIAVGFGAYLAVRYDRTRGREQEVERRKRRARAKRRALVQLLMAVADEGENARHILIGIIETAAAGQPEMAEVPSGVLEAATSSSSFYRTPVSLQVACRAYLSAVRTVRNMLEARRIAWAASGEDRNDTYVNDLKRAATRALRILLVMQREMQKLAPRYRVRRELDGDFSAVTQEIIAINNDQPYPPPPRR